MPKLFRRALLVPALALFGASAGTMVAACSQPQTSERSVASLLEGGPEPKAIQLPGTAEAGIADAGPVNFIGALFMQTPIMSDMEWPLPEGSTKRDPEREKVVRIGYIRRGGKVPVMPEAHRKTNCADGWYELVAGGFVCGKYATLDLNHPKVKFGPHAPDMNAPLPYQYGYNITNGTPLYRTMPSKEDRKLLEPWLTAKPKAKIEDDSPYDDNLDAGGRAPLYVGAPTEESETPWYMKTYDGGKPPVTLDDLKGEGPIVRRMVKGFYLALDEELKKDELKRGRKDEKWWKTVSGDIVPMDRIYLAKPLTDFHGVWLNAAPANLPTVPGNPPAQDAGVAEPAIKFPTKLPVGFILWHGHKYTPSEDGKKMVRGDSLSRFTAIGLSGKKTELGGFRYHESEDGTFWMRSADGQITSPGPAPKGLLPNEKWIDVNLDSQTLVAFEGDRPVYVTLTSTGKKDKGDKEKDHRTKPGEFRIREKHIAATMDGDVATDGPYSIEDVPWIMYFNASIALHGAFWHANFGHIQSHGCVNLAPLDARAMFGWTEPQLPEGWHGVMATPQKPGTRVVVHETWDPNDPLSIKPIPH